MTAQIKNLFKSRKGFTLIELLVVIGILGVLAAALIATIDPFEQIRKAQDTNVKDIAVQYVDANVRYYTTHSLLPWGITSSCNGQADPNQATLGVSGMLGCLTTLVYDGELKPAFTGVTAALSAIVVTGTSDSVTACFKPISKAQLADPNTKYTNNGSINASCPSQTAGCYWCTY